MTTDRLDVVRVDSWARIPWLRHGFSTRTGGASTVYSGESTGGELNLGFTKDDQPEVVAGNRKAFLQAVGGPAEFELVTVRQVHGTKAKVVEAGDHGLRTADGRAVIEADALMSSIPGAMLGIQVADCVPVLVADVKRRIVAGFHAGWRGTATGIVELGVARMIQEFGCDPIDLLGAVGPSIGACCYTVGDEVRTRFGERFDYAAELFSDREDGMHVDLAEANRRQLVGAGLHADRVTVIIECTACARVNQRRKYFSHRAEKGFTGRSMAMIGIARD